MRNETNCDAVMIGRGALGNPWLFKAIIENRNDKYIDELSLLDRINICIRHFKLLKNDKSERICVNLGKKHLSYYLRGFNGAAKWRKDIMRSIKSENIIQILNEIKRDIN